MEDVVLGCHMTSVLRRATLLRWVCCTAGLALYKGQIYAAFGSHCDRPAYYPFIFAFDAKSLAINSFWTSPVLICAPAAQSCLNFVE